MIADALAREKRRVNSSFVGINMSNSMRGSTFRVSPPNVSTPELPTTRELEAAGVNGVPTRLLRPDVPRRQSATERFATWIQNRLSGRPPSREFDQQALSRRDRDMEFGQAERYDYTDEKRPSADSDASSMQPLKEPEYGWRDPAYANIRTPPTGTSTAVNDTPQFAKQAGPSDPSSSKLRESSVIAAYTPATSYAPAESRPVGPNSRRGPSSVPTIYSTMVSEALSPVTVAALAPVNPLSIRSLPSNPRLRPREPPSQPEAAPAPVTMPIPQVARAPSPPAIPEAAESPSGTSFRITREYGSPARSPVSRSQRNPGGVTNGDESPIYGLEGIIASLGGDLLPDEELRRSRDSAAYSPGAASFQRKQAELDRSVAYLQSFAPRSPPAQPQYGMADGASQLIPSPELESTSYRSDFTLSNFPSPPPAVLGYPSFSRRNSVAARPGEVDLDDLRFTLTPPRMPAAADGRQTSFPSTTRGSDILQFQSRSADTSSGAQWDVTSFIGGKSSLGSPLCWAAFLTLLICRFRVEDSPICCHHTARIAGPPAVDCEKRIASRHNRHPTFIDGDRGPFE